jgi:hypothetical protein
MALDPVTLRAARTPMFIAGAVLLILGILPLVLTIIFVPQSNAVGPGILMWILVPIGSILVWRSLFRASRDWRQGK